MKMLLGNIESRKPLAFAEAALLAAWECSPRSQAKFALTCGPDRRLYVRRYNFENRINQSEWIATFTRKADPDWLAEEIEAARGVAA